MPTTTQTNEARAAETVFDLMQEMQPDFDLDKFMAALRAFVIKEAQLAVRNPDSYTPEEWDFWQDQANDIKRRL